jgi:predicted acylesterase/phospholipase RssA
VANYLIISCDGGGIRGLIPALFLQKLNQTPGVAGFLTNGSVRLYAGTSAGSFIALGLAAGTSIDTIANLFQTKGSQIFQKTAGSAAARPRPPLPAMPPPAGAAGDSWWDILWKELVSEWEALVDTKYTNAGLRGVLSQLFPNNQPLSQLAPVVAVTFQLSTPSSGSSRGAWEPLLLGNQSNLTTKGVGIVDAALASGAAPTYFPPYQPPGFNFCTDGGVAANNPSVVALAQAMQGGQSPSNIYLLSLGTGANPDALPNSTVNLITPSLFGVLTWMFPVANPGGVTMPAYPLLTGLFDASSEMFDYLAGVLLPPQHYCRVNPPLTTPVALDDYSPTAICAMTDAVHGYSEWSELTSWLQTALGK